MTTLSVASPERLPRRIVTYARVSSDDQAERGTIATQTGVLEQRIAITPDIEVVGRFLDDGVSGTIPIAERPQGRRMLAVTLAGGIDEVWVYKVGQLHERGAVEGRCPGRGIKGDLVEPIVWQDVERFCAIPRTCSVSWMDRVSARLSRLVSRARSRRSGAPLKTSGAARSGSSSCS